MSKKLDRLRPYYEGMKDADILKAQEKVEYVLYEKTTGEIIQVGDMDLFSFEQFVPPNPEHEKMIVSSEKAWRLRGEFIDHEGDHKHMFKLVAGNLEAKLEHETKIDGMKLPSDRSDQEIEMIKKRKKDSPVLE